MNNIIKYINEMSNKQDVRIKVLKSFIQWIDYNNISNDSEIITVPIIPAKYKPTFDRLKYHKLIKKMGKHNQKYYNYLITEEMLQNLKNYVKKEESRLNNYYNLIIILKEGSDLKMDTEEYKIYYNILDRLKDNK